MGTPATGELRKLASGYEARIRIEGKTRKGFALTAVAGETAARARCTAMAVIASRLRDAGHASKTEDLLRMAAKARPGRAWDAVTIAVDALCTEGGVVPLAATTAVVTFGELANEWTSGKLHARFPDHVGLKDTSAVDALRFGKWIFPLLEHVPLHAVTLEHAQEVMRGIPPSKSSATRRHVGQLMSRVLRMAVFPCKYIDRSPLPDGFMPRMGKAKALSYLYPDEDARLLACPAVPFPERLLYGLLAREGLRCEEALSLRWLHLDLSRGSIRVDVNKTEVPRAWSLDPAVARALRAWKAQHPDDGPNERVFRDLARTTRIAHGFRTALRVAGIDRAELFERSAVRRPIRAHDLRATAVTVWLANGKTEAWCCDRTGHTTSTMLNRYRRSARAHSELGLGTLTPLDEALGLPHECPGAVSSGGNSGDLANENAEKPTIPAEIAAAVGHSSGCERTRDRRTRR